MTGFKKVTGEKIDDVSQYVKEYIEKRKHENIEILIGTDSQRLRRTKGIVSYATVICIYTKGKGAHVIVKKSKRNDIKDFFTRLWHEVELSVELASYLVKKLPKNLKFSIHIDLNDKQYYKSNSVYLPAMGYVKSLGFECKAKPDNIVAICAANMLCR